ncbi:4'-phosphopantetheinyl transferase family protein [Deinococcus marmoris]|uniref:4'-phosphopantetheinyl transferase family protein n=1 Tax=Deinococcus marmoris TaxID=249408 RepID=UPI00069207A0|nr:4'-phosphopantetheinyl transferase superfamily protein [Deinococcus marmoris]
MSYSPHESDLQKKEVSIWVLVLEGNLYDMPTLNSLLSGAERERGRKFKLARDGTSFVIAHAMKRLILGRALGVQPHALSFEVGLFGKPSVKGGGLYFSLSRSGDYALLALGRHHQIGIDLELVRPLPELDAIAAQHFSTADQARLDLAGEDKLVTFFDLWTAHEAVLKAAGVGLSGHTFGPAGAWTYQNLALIEGYRAALAAPRSAWSVKTYDQNDVIQSWLEIFLFPND